MGASELDEWVQYAMAEPFGALRDNLHAGIIASVVVNALRKKGKAAFTPHDFLLTSREDKRQKSLADGIAQLRALSTRRKP